MSRASRDVFAQGVASGITNAFDVYKSKREEENALKTFNDPNASTLQKTLALSRVNPQVAAQVYKAEAQQSALQNLKAQEDIMLGNVPREAGGPQQATRNAANTFMNPASFAQPETNMGQNVPPNVEMGGQPEQVQPQLAPEEKAEALRSLATQAENAGLHNQATDYRSRADAEQKKIIAQNKIQRGIYESEKSDAQKRNEGFLKTVDGWRSTLPFTRHARLSAENAIKTGDFSALSKNNLAYLIGRAELKDAPAAQLDIALKQNLLDTISNVSAKFGNKWLEQVAFSAFPGYGRSLESNLTMAEALRTSEEMQEALIQASDKIAENDRRTLGYEGPDFQKRVFEAATPELKNIMDKTAYRTRSLYEDELSRDDLREVSKKKPPPGTPLTRKMFQVLLVRSGSPEKAIENAKKLGYTIYPNSKVEEFTR